MRRRTFLAALGASAVAARAKATIGTRTGTHGASGPRTTPRLDAHAHVNSPAAVAELEAAFGQSQVPEVGADELVRRLDAHGIERAVMLSTAYMMATEAWEVDRDRERDKLAAENDHAAREAARHPDRLVPFLSLNPKRPWAVEEIDRCVDELSMRGLKLHFWNSMVDVRDETQRRALRKVLDHASGRGLPVVAHAYVGDVPDYGPRDVEILAREVVLPLPDLRISFAHLAGAGGFDARVQACWSQLCELAGPESDAAERVFVDLSATVFGPGNPLRPATTASQRSRLADLLERWGLERVLWGSDNIETALADCRATWPLDEEDWSVVCEQTGELFLDG